MKNIANIIDLINSKIKNAFSGYKGIYLYGSYSRSEESDESDVDIVALFSNSLSREERMHLWSLISNIEGEYNIVLDIHPMAKDELERNFIYYDQVVNKGVFYGA